MHLARDLFTRLAVRWVRHITPKGEANQYRAIEFSVMAGGVPIRIRCWAPENYRAVFVKAPTLFPVQMLKPGE